MDIINIKMLSHPVNWGIVWVALLLSAAAYTFVHDGVKNKSSDFTPD